METGKKMTGLFLFLWLLPFLGKSQQWERIADFDITRRMYGIAFAINGKGYAGFGHDYNSLNPFNDLWAYDTAVNTWTEIAWFEGQNRTAPFCFVYDSSAYIGGGSNDSGKTSLHSFFRYTPGVDGFSNLASCPARYAFGASALVCGQYAYLMGGCNMDSCERMIYRYGIAADKWDTVCPAPFHGKFGVSFMLDSCLYYGMPTSRLEDVTAEFWKLDLRSMRWDRVKPIPGQARSYAISAAADSIQAVVGLGFNAKKYILALSNSNANVPAIMRPAEEEFMYHDLWLYNCRKNKWRRLPAMPGARRGAVSFVLGNYLYIGMGNVENQVKTDFWRIKLK